jgi:hypothetical protein
MYTLYLPTVGEVVLHFATIRISGFRVYISGYDEYHERIDFIMDKLAYPDDRPEGCGYCHIISYTMHGVTVSCNYYKSIH